MMPFREHERRDDAFKAIPFNFKDYIDLVDRTGRHIRAGKRGSFPSQTIQFSFFLEP
jgi:hypothetical protein